MAKRYPPNHAEIIREHFRMHPYYKLCKAVFRVFQGMCPTMVMTSEQLFEDGAQTLDRLLQTGDVTKEICQDLWTEKYNLYRQRDKSSCTEETTMAEVAMLLYVVMYGLLAVKYSHYRGTLMKELHSSVITLYYRDDIQKCKTLEGQLREPVNQHSEGMTNWMGTYFISKDSLTLALKALFTEENNTGDNKPGNKAKDFESFIINTKDVDYVIETINLNMSADDPKQTALVIIGGIEAGKIRRDVSAPSIQRKFGVKGDSVKPYLTDYRGYKNGTNNAYSEDELKPYKDMFCGNK